MVKNKKNFQNNRGFTLIEVLLSIALITAITGIGIPVFNSFQHRNNIDVIISNTVQTVRRAQTLSRAGEGDDTWGAYVTSTSVTLFRGSSYATRNPEFDEIYDIPSSIEPSGVSEIVFSEVYGEPNTTGTITFTTPIGQEKSLTINEKGRVAYEGASGGKVICTELYAQGLLAEEIYKADQVYGRKVAIERPYLLSGYHAWAYPIVSVMQKSKTVTHFIGLFAKPWARQMAYEMGVGEKGSRFGKAMKFVGEPATEGLGIFLAKLNNAPTTISQK